jgi:DNA-binding NtrC family response regulator
MITAFGSIENAVKCVKAGAYDYLTKPFNLDDVVVKVKRALDNADLVRELDKFKI